MKKITIKTDGACKDNPGRGGIGYVLMCDGRTSAGQKGFIKSTSNRMELMAVIESLKVLKFSCEIELMSDSRYVIDPIEKGWLEQWQTDEHLMNRQNADLWRILIFEMKRHKIVAKWIPREENTEADRLAKAACQMPNPVFDYGYEQTRPKEVQQTLLLNQNQPNNIAKPSYKMH